MQVQLTYHLMLPTVLVGRFHPIPDISLDSRINHQLLPNRVPGQLPGELVLKGRLLLGVSGAKEVVVDGLHLLVVVSDSVQDA